MNVNVKRLSALLLLILAITITHGAKDDHQNTRQQNLAVVEEKQIAFQKKYANNPDILVLRGLIADRLKKQITIYAEATGLDENGSPPEFFLVAENSGHDYEAVAISFAKPSDIHKALVFIGMESGLPINYSKLRFWPKGERVIINFVPASDTKQRNPIRAEELFVDKKTNKPLPRTGFVFTGSFFVTLKNDPNAYAADVYEPNAIISNYNEPTSVFDVPRQSEQHEVYDKYAMNTNYIFPSGTLLEITIEPENKDSRKRVHDFLVNITTSSPQEENKPLLPKLEITTGNSKDIIWSDTDVRRAFKFLCEKAKKENIDPFVVIRFAPSLPVKLARDVCIEVVSFESESDIRVEPPLPGELYYKAFLPNESHRDRNKRPSQPCELHLKLEKEQIVASLTYIRQEWKDNELKPQLFPKDFDITSPANLRKKLDELCRAEVCEDVTELSSEEERTRFMNKLNALSDEALWTEELQNFRRELREVLPLEISMNLPPLRVLLVFANKNLTYGKMMEFIRPIMATHSTIHVFIEE